MSLTPALERVIPPDSPSRQGLRRAYNVNRFQPDATGRYVQRFEGVGTHIFLAELTGSDLVYVRTAEGMPWVPMDEGDTLVREFLWFEALSVSRFGDALNGYRALGGPTEATFYVSTGPLILKAPKKYGIRSGAPVTSVVASATGADFLANFAAQYAGMFPKGLPAALRYGGSIIVRNTDAADSAYLYFGVPGSYQTGAPGTYPDSNTALELPALTTMVLQVENRIANLRHPDPSSRATTLVVASETGTPLVQIMLSKCNFDWSDPESIPAGSGISPLATS